MQHNRNTLIPLDRDDCWIIEANFQIPDAVADEAFITAMEKDLLIVTNQFSE